MTPGEPSRLKFTVSPAIDPLTSCAKEEPSKSNSIQPSTRLVSTTVVTPVTLIARLSFNRFMYPGTCTEPPVALAKVGASPIGSVVSTTILSPDAMEPGLGSVGTKSNNDTSRIVAPFGSRSPVMWSRCTPAEVLCEPPTV